MILKSFRKQVAELIKDYKTAAAAYPDVAQIKAEICTRSHETVLTSQLLANLGHSCADIISPIVANSF